MVIFLPEAITFGTLFPTGETTTFEKASFTLTNSLKVRVCRVFLTLRLPGRGSAETKMGGSSSRGPPEGLPILAQPAIPLIIVTKIKTTTRYDKERRFIYKSYINFNLKKGGEGS